MLKHIVILFVVIILNIHQAILFHKPIIQNVHLRPIRAVPHHIPIGVEYENTLLDVNVCGNLSRQCKHFKGKDTLSILECVYSLTPNQLIILNDKCQHSIWHETQSLLTKEWLEEELLQKHCRRERNQLDHCIDAAYAWSCMKARASQFDQNNKCQVFIDRVYNVLFVDFENLGHFLNSCVREIEKYKCGRLNMAHRSISQLETIECLQHMTLGQLCQTSIGRIRKSYTDLLFFEICAQDIQNLCSKEMSGTVTALECLFKNRINPSLSQQCSDQITERSKEIEHEYRMSRGLAKACKDDIKRHHCKRGVSEDKQVRLAQILLCLETAQRNRTIITIECKQEIENHRRQLMQDNRLSPELLNDCADDIGRYCGNVEKLSMTNLNLEYGMEIIRCLLDHGRIINRKEYGVRSLMSQCQRSLEAFTIEIGLYGDGEDWSDNTKLRKACKPIVDVACRDKGSSDENDTRVMSCLMAQLGTKIMNSECEYALLTIQYYVIRDFQLDVQFYKNCRNDVKKYCDVKYNWYDTNTDNRNLERDRQILPCLQQISYSNDPQITLHSNCLAEIKRVTRPKLGFNSNDGNLIPEIDGDCSNDLLLFCSGFTEKGDKIECLQNNLEKLQVPCKIAVTAYTEEEAAHVELNPVIMSVCSEAMKTHCDHILGVGWDKGDMMDCLIAHKNDADLRQNQKCRAAIEHFQIISLKSYHFTYKFKQACRPYVVRFCTTSTKKNEVVACLSEVMRNDTIRAQRHSIPKECRQQIKAQLYQKRESLALDPKLSNACKNEINEFCYDKKGPGEAIECLTLNTALLGSACHHAIFMLKKSELVDSAVDFTLLNTCKQMTYKFCLKTDPMYLLDCLKSYKDDSTFDKRCHLVVVNRMIEQNTDYRFNPTLQLHCGKNINQFCSDIVAQAQPYEELNGKVIQCLKDKFRESLLNNECAEEMIKILQEQALNYKLNPVLQTFCKHEISVLCNPDNYAEEHGLVEECLKTAFLNHKIINQDCRLEVATLIAEAKADIHVDPILEEACTVDLLRYCSNVKSGNGRKLKCLQMVLHDQSKAMENDCQLKLQRRIEMFQNADTVLMQPPINMEQLVQQVVTSPAKRFFIVILISTVGMVFIMGIFLGRVTKRAIITKNK